MRDLTNVKIPDVDDNWNGKMITNDNIKINDWSYCFDIHYEQTEKYSHQWPYVATGDRIRKLLPEFLNPNKRLKGDGLIFCGNRNDLTGTFQKLGRYMFSNFYCT